MWLKEYGVKNKMKWLTSWKSAANFIFINFQKEKHAFLNNETKKSIGVKLEKQKVCKT